jgi:glutamine synthetase
MKKKVAPIRAEYIWIDGRRPTGKLRSKTKILHNQITSVKDIPTWGFDGSSTEQAQGNFSDLLLIPVNFCLDPINEFDPINGKNHILVLCEVFNVDNTPHVTNNRVALRNAMKKYKKFKPIVGIEQEYTLYGENDWPLGWPKGRGYPSPQGRYYCGVGFDEVHGRPLVDAHLEVCLKANLAISGINAEVMPAQWEFQVGPLDPLEASDQLWLARWLLYRLGEDYGAYAKLDPKPMSGDWNGAGAHTNFSTKEMREKGSYEFIEKICKKLEKFHRKHMKVYGAENEKRLTGVHETCRIDEFRHGKSDRGASIRVPVSSKNLKSEYLEDRRPGSNIDPYQVCTALLETICGEGFNPEKYNW